MSVQKTPLVLKKCFDLLTKNTLKKSWWVFFGILFLQWPWLRYVFGKLIRRIRNLPPGPEPLFGIFSHLFPKKSQYVRTLLNNLSHTYGSICYFSFGVHNIAMISDPKLARELFDGNILDRCQSFWHPLDQPNDFSWKNGHEWRERRKHATSLFFRNATSNYVTNVVKESIDTFVLPELQQQQQQQQQQLEALSSSVSSKSIIWFPKDAMYFLTWNITYACLYGYTAPPTDSMYCAAELYEQTIPKSWNILNYSYQQFMRWILRRVVNLWWDQTMSSDLLFPSFRRRTHLHSGCGGSYLDSILRMYGTEAAYGEMQAMLDSHESMSNTLEFVFAYAAKYPNIQEQIRDEIKAIKPSAIITNNKIETDTKTETETNPFVSVDILNNLKHVPTLRAFVHDVLRASGTGSWGIPRTSGSEEIWINGYRIPKNTVLITNAEYIQKYSPHLWKNASFGLGLDEICLANWLKKNEQSGELLFTANDNQPFFAFGTGKRICPGREMALKVVYFVFGQIVYNYKIEMAPKDQNPHWDEFLHTAGTGIQRLLHSPCVQLIPIMESKKTSL